MEEYYSTCLVDFPGYEINKNGEIRNSKTKEIKSRKENENGYIVKLYGKDGKLHTVQMHVLMAEMFLGKTENKKKVQFINDNNKDINVENIKWTNYPGDEEEFYSMNWVFPITK